MNRSWKLCIGAHDHFGELGAHAMFSAQLPPYQRFICAGARVNEVAATARGVHEAVGGELGAPPSSAPLAPIAPMPAAAREPLCIAMSWPRIAFAVGGGGALEYSESQPASTTATATRAKAANRCRVRFRLSRPVRARSGDPVRRRTPLRMRTVDPSRRRRIRR